MFTKHFNWPAGQIHLRAMKPAVSKYDIVTDIDDLKCRHLIRNFGKENIYSSPEYVATWLENNPCSSAASATNEFENLSLASGSSGKPISWPLRLTKFKPFSFLERRSPKVHHHVPAADECENQYQFQASPAPNTTNQPLYTRMKADEKNRTLKRKASLREITTKMQKPFDFFFRESTKQHFKRTESTPNLSKVDESREFKASPLPSFYARVKLDMEVQTSTPVSEESRKQILLLNQEMARNFPHVWSSPIKRVTSEGDINNNVNFKEQAVQTSPPTNDSVQRRCFTVGQNDDGVWKTKHLPRGNWSSKLRFQCSRVTENVPDVAQRDRRLWRSKLKNCVKEKVAMRNIGETANERLYRKRCEMEYLQEQYRESMKTIKLRVNANPLLMEERYNKA